jgi:hypothetical protein
MLFSLFAAANAGSYVITTFPCQRLGWAWRNVWVTCSIDTRVPGTMAIPSSTNAYDAAAPNINEGLNFIGNAAYTVPNIDIDIPSGNYYMVPGFSLNTAAQKNARFCTAVGSPTNPVIGVRTACRRAIDLYGSLLELCRNPLRSGLRTPVVGNAQAPSNTGGAIFVGTQNQWQYAIPGTTMAPHASNVAALNSLQQLCANTAPVSPSTSCPGLVGWFTVVYQACNFNNVKGGTLKPPGANTPEYQTTVAGAWKLVGTGYELNPLGSLCDTTAASSTAWNPSGPGFRGTACRRAIDQFTRTANRCQTMTGYANFVPNEVALTKFGVYLGLNAPEECK